MTAITQCPYCSMQCTIRWQEHDGTDGPRYAPRPNPNDPVVHGKWCGKGLNAHVPAVGPDRLTRPLLRKHGRLVPVSWEEALMWFGERFGQLRQEWGPSSIGVYGGGSLTNESAYLLGKFARVALQTPYIDYNGRYCMSSAASAAIQTFGVDRGLTNPLSDLPPADCIILAGTNIADCQPTMMPYLMAAKRRGATLIAIDPRVTKTTRIADIHLAPRPGSDAALVNGLLKTILEEGWTNPAFIQAHTTGIKEVEQHIRAIPWHQVEQATDLTREAIQQAARAYGQAATGFVLTARGVEQQAHGVMNVRNYLNLVLVTGKIGRPGCGYGAVTGQANGQGGREHGQKADQLPGYRLLEDPEARRHIAQVWGVDEAALPHRGVSAYEMFDKIHRGAIRGLIVFASNPVVSSPHARRVADALARLDHLVVVDLYPSETAAMADLVLPGSSHLESEGTLTTLEGRVTLRRAVRPLPGEARLDWRIIGDLAHSLGRGEGFRFHSSEAIFAELRLASRGGIADYHGVTYERIKREQGVFWPCSEVEKPDTPRLFAGGRFFHPDGKARLVAVANDPSIPDRSPAYPLILTTGRVIEHYLSGNQTRRTPALNRRVPTPRIQVHPDTARQAGVKDGETARLTTPRGTICLPVEITDAIRPDTVFVPMHWGGEQGINRLVSDRLDPFSRMPSFKCCGVRLEPVNPSRREKEEAEAVHTG